jgi:tetratricopeptide (TPR) repeat protein
MKTFKRILIVCLIFRVLLQSDLKANNFEYLIYSLKSAKDEISRINIMNDICWKLRYEKPDTALFYGQKAKCLSEKIHYKSGIINSHINISSVYIIVNKFDLAMSNYSNAIKIIKNASLSGRIKHDLARIYEGIGLLSYKQNDYKGAIEYYSKALSLYNEIAKRQNVSACYDVIGQIYEKAGDENKARGYYYKQLQYQSKYKIKIDRKSKDTLENFLNQNALCNN